MIIISNQQIRKHREDRKEKRIYEKEKHLYIDYVSMFITNMPGIYIYTFACFALVKVMKESS